MNESSNTALRQRTADMILDDRLAASSHLSQITHKAAIHDKPTGLITSLLRIALRRLGKFNPDHHVKPEKT